MHRSVPIQTIISGLSSAMDIVPVSLEFSTNQLAGAPGQLWRFDEDGSGAIVVPGSITPTSMARDDSTDDIFVTNIYPGTVTIIDF